MTSIQWNWLGMYFSVGIPGLMTTDVTLFKTDAESAVTSSVAKTNC
jgi:hypothetical protein